MPEGLTGGTRTWRQFLRYRRRRQDLQEELEDTQAKKTSAAAHLQAMDTKHQALLQEAKQLDEDVSRTSRDLRLLDEDMELVLVLKSGQVKVDLEAMTELLNPDFSDTRLVKHEELKKLETTAEKCVESERADGVGEGGGENGEVEALRALRGQLQLEVELARQDLHHINTLKVGRDVMAAATNAVAGSGHHDPSQLYASLQRLQQIHGERVESMAAGSNKVVKQLRQSRRKVSNLQRQVDDLAQEIDDLQTQVAQAQPELHLAKRENRLRRVMACSDLTTHARQRQAIILDLEHELDTLRLRTFPMLSRPPQPPTI
ncbi:uncharacterized protein LOC121856448 [Homarus americanus]|uniref:uncharacterized protein LOC121856448 n=1 Tax=Homarus americanus TaxID=6706 RepID=UPI001C486661|nr:uncharacterized protein LOC121856448 [Homarus americanus]